MSMPNPRVQQVSRLLFRNIGHAHKPFTSDMVKRIHSQPTMSTQSIDFKAPHSAKTKQAWRYAGNKVVRASSVMLGGTKYTDPKDPGQPRRKQESNFFITINSNKSPEKGDEMHTAVKHMEQMLKKISTESVLATYIMFGPKDKWYEEDKYGDVVHSVEWKSAVETGDTLKRLHAHIWLTITHYSQIQINVRMLMHQSRIAYNEGLPFSSQHLRITAMPYVHVKLLPQSDWTDVMKQYIHKGMTAA